MINWLTAHVVGPRVAHIHPTRAVSQVVALNLGLRPTPVVDDGEVRWQPRTR
jgi:hypothetical protein